MSSWYKFVYIVLILILSLQIYNFYQLKKFEAKYPYDQEYSWEENMGYELHNILDVLEEQGVKQ